VEPRCVELLDPPASSVVGQKVFIDGFKDVKPDDELNPKKKVWDTLKVCNTVIY